MREKDIIKLIEENSPNKFIEIFIGELSNTDSNKLIDIFFGLINKTLDNYIEINNKLEKIYDYYKYINLVLDNTSVNRAKLKRKIIKLEEKISRLLVDNKDKCKKNIKIFKNISKENINIYNKLEIKQPNNFIFVEHLLTSDKNISKVENIFNKIPSLVNVKDKDNNHILLTILEYIINNYNDQEDYLFYYYIFIILTSNDKFNLNQSDKLKCKSLIDKSIDNLSVTKSIKKKNKKIISLLEDIKEDILSHNNKNIDNLINKYDINRYFNNEILDNIRKIDYSYDNRYVIDDYVVTIDDNNTFEIDDGLSCKKLDNGNYLLGIHTASVLSYFPYESNVIQDAINRSSTIYLPKKVKLDDELYNLFPIFPLSFSTIDASLIEGEKRYTKSFYYEIDSNGSVINSKILNSVIAVDKKLNYNDVCDILNLENNNITTKTVNNLLDVSKILGKRYIHNISDNYNTGEKIVYYIMIFLGEEIAKRFKSLDIPCLYRVHDKKDEECLQKLDNIINDCYAKKELDRVKNVLLGIEKEGWYDLSGSHSGLGLDSYVHITSELRRSADIVNEHALNISMNQYNDKDIYKLEDEVKRVKDIINNREKMNDLFLKEYKKIKKR